MKLLLIGFILLTAAYAGIRWASRPERLVLEQLPSPNKQWSAIVERQVYAPSFTPPVYSIKLQSQQDKAASPILIFEIAADANTTNEPPFSVEWKNDRNLEVSAYNHAASNSVYATKAGNIVITYK